jgi:hypothetical protein
VIEGAGVALTFGAAAASAEGRAAPFSQLVSANAVRPLRGALDAGLESDEGCVGRVRERRRKRQASHLPSGRPGRENVASMDRALEADVRCPLACHRRMPLRRRLAPLGRLVQAIRSIMALVSAGARPLPCRRSWVRVPSSALRGFPCKSEPLGRRLGVDQVPALERLAEDRVRVARFCGDKAV